MRYSRFRAAMLGLEPQRRNRTNPNRSRVSKRKKEDGTKVKKEEAGGSGDTIKAEDATDTAATIKAEPAGIKQQSPPPSRPAAPAMPTAPVKTEPGLAHHGRTHGHQHQHPSILSVSSPKVKQEKTATVTSNGNPTPPMPEPYPFGIVTAAPTSTSTAAAAAATPLAFSDIHPNHRAQMRLLTPNSDSDIMHGPTHSHTFIPHSPAQAENDFFHSHHHPSHHPHHSSPTAASPYDFTAQFDAAVGGSPWHSQHQHHHPYHGYHSPVSVYSAGFAAAATGGAAAANGYGALDHAGYGAFCGGEHPPHHHHDYEMGLGLHAGSMFRERELEMGIGLDAAGSAGGDIGGSQDQGADLKNEWENGEY